MLSGKIILITGASSGMGLESVDFFRSAGAEVVAIARNGDKLKRALASLGDEIMCIPADVRRNEQCQQVVKSVIKRFSRVDGLVNYAGEWVSGNALELSESEFDHSLESNLKTAWLMSRAVLVPMIKTGTGAIVNVSSILGVKVVPASTAYATAKAALIQLTRSLALDFGPKGIRTNCVCPGLVDTPMTANVFSQPNWLKDITRGYPMGRLGKPTDIAPVAAFLLSDNASWINGAVLPIDGGYLTSSEPA
ncbi:MAG: SDR family oxidoreductase [Deltaproteobacteria bacterium]|nr:SDR family oxidoreductase [Deltaproteobacteria bacterium]